MRLVPVLLIALALSFAGCFGKKSDDAGTGDGTTPTDTSPTTSTPAGSTPVSSTPAGGNTTGGGTTPLAPKDVKSGTVTWPTDCNSSPAATCPSTAFTVDAGYTMLNFTVTWSCANGAPACASNGATLAAGSLSCQAPASISTQSTPAELKCVKTGAAVAGKVTATGDALGVVGTWKLVEQ